MTEVLPPWLTSPAARRAAVALIGLVLLWAGTRAARRFLTRRIDDAGTRYHVRKALNAAAVVIGAIFVASLLLQRFTGLGVALGVTGAGLAFALQEPILAVAGWVALSLGGYYRSGHRVSVGGVTGDVIDISILRTTLFETGGWVAGDSYNGRVVRVSNAAVLREPVYNYSGDFPFLWDEINVPMRHGSDRARARELLLEAAGAAVGDYVPEAQDTWQRLTRRYMLKEADVDPKVALTVDENWLTYTVRYAVEHRRRGTVKDTLWREVLDRVDAAGSAVELAATGQEVTVTPDSELSVRREGP